MISVPIFCRRLIGRERELLVLVERRRALAKSHGAVVLVSGDAGLGKSRLVRAFLENSRSARSRVAVAQCRPFGDRPYGAILDLLDVFAPGTAHAGSSRDDHQKRLVDGFLVASAKHALVAVIEDLHWADRGTAEILERLCGSLETRRILIVATYRGDEIHPEHPLYVPLAATMRKPAVWTIPLEPLTAYETAAFVDATLADVATSVSRRTRREVVRVCEGNPFFAEELLKGAIDRGDAERSGGVLPTTVRAAILQRMEPLDARDRRILTQAAVIGRRFGGDVLAQTLDTTLDALLPTLQRARRCQLVEETADPHTFRFRHALTREAIYDDLLAAQRRPLHERIAATLEASEADDERVLADLAYHWWACGNRAKALLYGERAGDTALREYEYAGAIAAYERTLTLLEPLERDAARVNDKMGTAYYRAGFMDRAIEHYELAWEYFRMTRDDPAYLFRTARNMSGALHNDGRVREALALWNDALGVVSACGDERWTTLARVQRAAYLVDAGDVAEALEALAPVDPDRLEADVDLGLVYWGSLCVASALQGDLERLHAAARRLFAMQPGRGNLGPLSDALLESGAAALYVGESALARRCFDAALAACVTMKSTDMLLADTLLVGAFERLLSGAYDAARAAAHRALPLVGETKISWHRARIVGAWLSLATGESNVAGELARTHIDEAFATGKPQIYGPLSALAAEAALRRGEDREARACVRRALDAALASASSLGSFPLAIAAAGACDANDAQRVRDLAERDAATGPAPAAAAALAEAILERRFGDGERAREHGRRAADGFAAVGWPYFEALGHAEARSGGPAPALPRATLTPREAEIAELVARGRSNREVASSLFVSVKLVEKQLSSIYRKFGVRSRTQLAGRVLARVADVASDGPVPENATRP